MSLERCVLIAVAVLLSQSAIAHARCCSDDSECPRGFSCFEWLTGDGGSAGMCSAVTDCTCDSECAPGLRCLPNSDNTCTDSDPPHCELHGQCVAPWQVNCDTDADCGGAGFRCVHTGSDGECQNPDLPDTCAVDADCPRGWTCENDDVWEDQCVQWAGSCTPNGPCPPRAGKNLCRPPLWNLVEQATYLVLDAGTPSDTCSDPQDAGALEVKGARVRAQRTHASSGCAVSAHATPTDIAVWPIAIALLCLRRRTRRG